MAAPCAMAKAKLAQEVATAKQYPLSDRIVSGIKTSYLATATSRVKHISSVLLTQGYRALAEQPVKVAADYIQAIGKAAFDHKLGEFQKYRETSYVNPVGARAIKQIGGVGVEGLREAWEAIRTGVDPERAANAFDIGKVQLKNPLLRAVQNRIDVVVSASNKPFFNMALQASLLDQAQTLARVSEESVDYHLQNISDTMAQRAVDEATHATFNDNGPVAQALAAWKGALRRARDNPNTLKPSQRANAQALSEGLTGDAAIERANKLLALKPSEFNKQVTVPRVPQETTRMSGDRGTAGMVLAATELAVPFARIGLNLGEAGAKMTPVGVPLALAKYLFGNQDGRVLVDGITKAVAGTASLVALGYYLQRKGVITGQSATSPSQKRTAGAQGEQPYAINIGNTSHRYDWVEPISFPLALGADLAEQQTVHPGHLADNLAKAEGKNLAMLSEKGILGSFATVADAAKGDAGAAMRYVQGILSPPPLVSQIAKGTDPVANRDTRSETTLGALGNSIKSKIPGLRETLPAKPDALGNAPPRAEGLIGALVDPSNPTTLTHDPVADELAKHGVGLSAIGTSGSIDKQRFIRSIGEQQNLSKQTGTLVRQRLTELMADPQYQSATHEDQTLYLKDVVRTAIQEIGAQDNENRVRIAR